MNILFFDTETTGKPKNYKAHMTDIDNWPRVTQLAWQIWDTETRQCLASMQSLVTPDNWEVPKEEFFIKNNMSTERCRAEGRPLPELLEGMIWRIESDDARMMVAHNIAFDHPVLGAEMIRYNFKLSRKLDRFCTMQTSTNICKLPGQYGFKWPKLEELHRFLFECDFENAHDASGDVTATAKCFFELLDRGLIKLPVTA